MRIVVVEDNKLYRDELLQCLEQEESDIEIIGSAANGARGLALVEKLVREKAGPDVIFTDIRMPEMDGFEMIEALQKRKISCKIVITSSCPEFLYAKRAMELGAVDFLVKPLKTYEVRNVLRRLRRELESEKKWKHILKLDYIFPNTARGRVICTWAVSDGFENMHEAVRELDHAAEWNLILKKGTLICKEKIQEIKLHSYKYPLHLEIEAKEALMNKDLKRFKEIFSRYQTYCRELPCTPQEAKEGCTHIALVLIQMAAEAGALQAQRKGQAFLQGISRANGWTDVEEKADEFFEYLTSKEECHNNISLLMQKALENIREYYNQGITLEEIAEKLHVTEEYLSTQFRKETGRTFTETIRGYRLEHVKKLLTVTNWKLTKIAEMVGYTDPKYMSRVFKEETGMLPLEYRKKNS